LKEFRDEFFLEEVLWVWSGKMEGDGMRGHRDEEEERGFPIVSFCVYIGHRRRYRKNKNPKVLSTGHSPYYLTTIDRKKTLLITPDFQHLLKNFL